jgi:hypothetical protein
MATLRELCKDVPQKLSREAVEYELLRRKNASYLRRMGELCAEENVFGNCRMRRPQKRKYNNRLWAEQCGGVGSFVATVRSRVSYMHVACKVKNY